MAEATAEARARGEESVAFYDNLHGQTTEEHENILMVKAKCARHLLPTGAQYNFLCSHPPPYSASMLTAMSACMQVSPPRSSIQLIDDGIGYAVKNEMGYALDRWLEEDDNLHIWTAEGLQFPMWRKRALITHFGHRHVGARRSTSAQTSTLRELRLESECE